MIYFLPQVMTRLVPERTSDAVPSRSARAPKTLRSALLAGVAALALSACATTHTSMPGPDYSGMSRTQVEASLPQLSERYRANPRDKATIIHFAAALRAAGQSGQAAAVLEAAMEHYKDDADIAVAYAKALTAQGRFEQALTVLDDTIVPQSPDWNALSVKGAILDQMGRNREARARLSASPADCTPGGVAPC
jgi:Flp pilus assembly protein TadD